MIRIGIVEDDILFLEALKGFLAQQEDMEVVGEALNVEEAVSFGTAFQPMDVLLVDCCLEQSAYDGVWVTQWIKERRTSPLKIIILTFVEEPDVILQAYAAGADHYILKSRYQELPHTIRSVMQEGTSPLDTLLEDYRRLVEQQVLAPLSAAEREIFDCLQQGKSRVEIADTLGKAEETVKTQIKAILRKLGASTTKEAVEKVKRREFPKHHS